MNYSPACVFSLILFTASLSSATTWDNNGGAGDSDIDNADNWSAGLPDNTGSKDGIINNGDTVEMLWRDDLDGANYIVSGGSTVHYADGISTFRWDDGTITLNSGGHLDIDYSGVSSIGHTGAALGSTTLNINTGATADFAGSLAVGREQRGFVNLYGGSLTVGGSLNVAANASGSVAGSVFTLYGGTVTAADYAGYHHNDPTDLNHFNFTTGSTGSFTILQDNFDFADLISDGEIRLNGNSSSDLADFSITNGAGFTTLALVPEPSSFALIVSFLAFAAARRRRS